MDLTEMAADELREGRRVYLQYCSYLYENVVLRHISQTHPDSLSSVEAAAAFLKALFSSSRAAAAGVAEAGAPVESDDPVVMVVSLSLYCT